MFEVESGAEKGRWGTISVDAGTISAKLVQRRIR
jgi:hypothetical protein